MSAHEQAQTPRGSRRRGKVAIACAAALSLGSLAFVGSSPNAAAAGTVDVQILAFNDYHGHVEGGAAGSIDGNKAGGGEYLSAKLTELRTGKANSLTVAAGDLIGGSPFFSGLFHDEPSVESLNAMGLDVSGVGNHEFDEGVTELLRMQNGGCHPVDGCYFTDYDPATAGDQAFGGAKFKWLAANVTQDGVIDPITTRPETPLPEYSIEEVGGVKIGFIGMTLEGTASLVAASGVTGYSFKDEVATANALVPDIKAAGAEAIVVLLHEGGTPNPFAINGCAGISGPIVAIAENLDAEIDAVVSGHTHQPYTCMINDPNGDPRSVTSAYSFGRVVTEISLPIDMATGEVIRADVAHTNHSVIQASAATPGVGVSPDPVITALIGKWSPLAATKGNVPVGSITATITRGGNPTGSDRGVESAAGNLVADAQLAAAKKLPQGAVLAFMNPGGVRSDLVFEQSGTEGDGVVTFGEAFTFQPFNNTLYVLPMTGEQIVSVLREQCQPGDTSRPVLHLGVSDGLTYDLAITTQGGVCSAVEVNNVMLNGSALLPSTTYNVAVNGFLADGGDNFGTFAQVPAGLRLDAGQDIDALTKYLSDAVAPVPPPSTDRVNETPTVLPGVVKSLTPARLLETRTGPNDKTVDGKFQGAGRVAADTEVELVVAGRGSVPGSASAAVLNIGVIRASASGFATLYPCGQDRPLTSNVNFGAGEIVANSVVAQIGAGGKVCVYTSAETDLIVDVNGAVVSGGSPTPVLPARLLETRDLPNKTVDGEFQGKGQIAAAGTVELVVTGRNGIVPADAKAVVINVAAVNPSGDGFFTVFPCGDDQPLASSLNFPAGQTTANSITAKIGTDGKVCIYSSVATHAIADVFAYVPVNGTPDALTPARLLETRDLPNKTVDGESQGAGKNPAAGKVEVKVVGRGGIPAGTDTVVLNVGVVNPTTGGFATVFPCDETQPLASNINFAAGQTVSNSVTAKVSATGTVCIYTSAETHLIADVNAAAADAVSFRTV